MTFRVMHGYGSATAVHDVATDSLRSEKPLTVFYVGDWDPSGLHMSEIDLPARVARYGGDVSIERVALTLEHVTFGDLPSFSADEKRRDPRHAWYVRHYGRRCWELDALSPVDLRATVEDSIRTRLDLPVWQRAEQAEQAERESLLTILNAWPGISRQAHE